MPLRAARLSGLLLAVFAVAALASLPLAGTVGADAAEGSGRTFAADSNYPEYRSAATGPEASGQAVIGDDERVRVTDTSVFPWRAIAWLGLYGENGNPFGSCTGTFVGPNVLLTAAHCLYDPSTGWTADIVVVPGKDSSIDPYGHEFAAEWWVPEGWIETEGSRLFDWGLIALDSVTLGETVGWFRIAVLRDETLSRSDFQPAVFGYPGDAIPAVTMWGSTREAFLAIDDFLLTHDVDTAPGESGAPVFSANVDASFLGHVVGVHVGSFGDDEVTVNEALRMDETLLADLVEGCRQLRCAIDSYIEDEELQPPNDRSKLTFRSVVPFATRE